ncbi:DUF6302 family protein [Streptomyces griseofuscus]|uniref:DUF6302 family protein n=1 Tax=Streptomyces griseofuscus TaxID=146922 RepID=UPI0033F644E4
MTTVRPINPYLLPARMAYDYEYFAERLADPSLLESALAVCVHRAPLLAVPVGGKRLGGYMSLDLLILAEKTRSLLAGRDGFPNVRVRPSPYRDTCHVVEWGGQPPVCDYADAARGQFYGYSEAAILRFFSGQGPPTPSSTAGQLSPTMP